MKKSQLKYQIADLWFEGARAMTNIAVENFNEGNYEDFSGKNFKDIGEEKVYKIGDESFCVSYQSLSKNSRAVEGGDRALEALNDIRSEALDKYQRNTGRENVKSYFYNRYDFYSGMEKMTTEQGDGGVIWEYSKFISDLVAGRTEGKVFFQIYEDMLKFYEKWEKSTKEVIRRNT